MSAWSAGRTMFSRKLYDYLLFLRLGCAQRQHLVSTAAGCLHRHNTCQLHTASHRAHTNLDKNIRMLPQIQQSVSISTTVHMAKQFDLRKMQRVNIYDPKGGYMQTSEIYNVEKFCDSHKKRYTFKTMEGSQSKAGEAEAALEAVQIVVKEKRAKASNTEEKIKTVKLKSLEAPWLVDNLKRLLLDHGSVLLSIEGRKTKGVKELIYGHWLAKHCNISTVKNEEGSILLNISLPDTDDTAVLATMFNESCAKDAAFLQQIRDLMAQTQQAEN